MAETETPTVDHMLNVVAGAAFEGRRSLNRRDRWMRTAREHGATLQQIADAAEMSPQGVRNALERPPTPAPASDDDDLLEVLDRLAERYGVQAICHYPGCGRSVKPYVGPPRPKRSPLPNTFKGGEGADWADVAYFARCAAGHEHTRVDEHSPWKLKPSVELRR